MEKRTEYNDVAMEVSNQMLYIAIKQPDTVLATQQEHDITLEQAILVSHLKRHLGLTIVSPKNLKEEWLLLEEERDQLAHEEEMLKSWTTGDTSLLPDGWSVYQQEEFIEEKKSYIRGVETTLNNLYNAMKQH